MRQEPKLDVLLDDPDYRKVFQQEKLILDVTESVFEVMAATRTSKSHLARRLDCTKGFVTQLLSGRRNLTLRSWADIMTVLGYQATVAYEPLPVRRPINYELTTQPDVETSTQWLDAGVGGQPRSTSLQASEQDALAA